MKESPIMKLFLHTNVCDLIVVVSFTVDIELLSFVYTLFVFASLKWENIT